MKGADEYYDLFPTGQRGRLYMLRGRHNKGKTFRIFVLPLDEEAENRHFLNSPTNSDAVEVYGVISGELGWTESYGWIYGGPWQKDFEKMVKIRLEIKEKEENKKLREQMTRVKTDRHRKIDLLSDYKEGDSK